MDDLRPAFVPNSRANRLEDYQLRRPVDPEAARRWVDLRGPDEVARQVQIAFAGAARPVAVPASRQPTWSHRFEMARGLPSGLTPMLKLLTDVLSMRRAPKLDVAIAFDWYKKVEEDIDPHDWANTYVGGLVHRGKYYRLTPWRQATALTKLVDLTVDFIRAHPLYANVEYVLSIPGSKADGESFGEKYAARVADATKKRLIATTCSIGARSEAKEGNTSGLMGNVEMPTKVRGPVIIVDDVYRSGSSMQAVAHAARKAGATRVFGLAAVKTIRS
ncbi:phosphoribosyltransferase [Actinoplanes sp. CA-131856]